MVRKIEREKENNKIEINNLKLKRMIIVFGNQKGGCGKTTNCIQFSNYLAEKGKDVLVLDLDFQQSIADRRKEDLALYDNAPRYEVIQSSLEQVASVIDDFANVNDGHLVIDLPGKLDDDTLTAILKSADIIICPFRYDKLTMDSTALFIKVIEYLKVKAKLFFLPNNINKSIRYDVKEQVIKTLQQFGEVTNEVPARVAMERVNTLVISNDAMEVVKSAYDYIIAKAEI
jgi:chromosome partitioning protein